MQSVYSATLPTGVTWVRVDLKIMAMKGHCTSSKSSKLKPHHQIQFSIIPRTLLILKLVLPLFREYNQYIQSFTDKERHQVELLVSSQIGHKVTLNVEPHWNDIIDINFPISCVPCCKCVSYKRVVSPVFLSNKNKTDLWLKDQEDGFCLFNRISTSYGLFNDKIWLICKCLWS